jgi:hypothetical protein
VQGREQDLPVAAVYAAIDEAMESLEKEKACHLCRDDIRSVRLLWEELMSLQEMYDDMADHPRRREWLLKFAEVSERIGVLAFLAGMYRTLGRTIR